MYQLVRTHLTKNPMPIVHQYDDQEQKLNPWIQQGYFPE